MTCKKLSSLTVYAASSCNVSEEYLSVARDLGSLLASRSVRCVYGAGPNGLMGAVANAVLDGGGTVSGVIPQFMVDRNWLNHRISETIITKDMHTRKQKMAEMSDACIALPGGIGTLEELLEIITWRQLGIYNKPVVILNSGGFFDPLLSQLSKIEEEGFMRHSHNEIWSVASTPKEALDQIDNQLSKPIVPVE